MKPAVVILAMLLAAAQFAVADDFKTIDGKEYKNVTVSRIAPDGIVLRSKSGISKIYFTELPKEVQERFNYDPSEAAAYSATEASKQEELRRRQEEAQRKLAEAKNKYWREHGSTPTPQSRHNRQVLGPAAVTKEKLQQLEQRGFDKETARRIAEICSQIAVARQSIQVSSSIITGGSGARFAAQEQIQRQEQRIQQLQKELRQLGGSCQ
jgi:hypothetical protein